MLGWIVLILIAWVFFNWSAAYVALAKLKLPAALRPGLSKVCQTNLIGKQALTAYFR